MIQQDMNLAKNYFFYYYFQSTLMAWLKMLLKNNQNKKRKGNYKSKLITNMKRIFFFKFRSQKCLRK